MPSISWDIIRELPRPPLEELTRTAEQEPVLFPPASTLTEDWLSLSQLYRALFSAFFLSKTGLDRLDRRLAERGFAPVPEGERRFFQRYDSLGLDYFYLRTMARVERLSAEERDALRNAEEAGTAESLEEAMRLVEETFRRVMPVDMERPNDVFEPKPTIHGDYRVRGSEIPLVICSAAAFDKDGNLLSDEQEKDRIQVFTNVWRQLDSKLSADLGCATKSAIEVFYISV